MTVPGAEWTKAFSKDSHYDNYWARQLPIIGNLYNAVDSKRYWDDYRKNTGFSPRYPGRTYANSGLGSALLGAGRSYGRMINRSYR